MKKYMFELTNNLWLYEVAVAPFSMKLDNSNDEIHCMIISDEGAMNVKVELGDSFGGRNYGLGIKPIDDIVELPNWKCEFGIKRDIHDKSVLTLNVDAPDDSKLVLFKDDKFEMYMPTNLRKSRLKKDEND